MAVTKGKKGYQQFKNDLAADTITGNCDCTLFLGGKEKSTLKEISEVLGKETIDLYKVILE